VPIAGSEFDLPVNMVIPAIGQRTVLGGLAGRLEVDRKWTTIRADSLTQATNLEGVFAGGDVVTGPATVVEAFGAGKRAAESIDRYLRGRDIEEGRDREIEVTRAVTGETAPHRPRARPEALSPDQRRGNFDEVVAGLSEEAAVAEAERCLGCGTFCESMQALDSGARRSVETTMLVTLEVDAAAAPKVAGIRIQSPAVTEPIETVMPPDANDDAVVACRCERVNLGQIRGAIRAGVRDMNQLKAILGCGLGSCGGKTCAPLIHSIFRREGVPDEEVTGYTERPLVTEVPFGLFAGVDTKGKGGAG
jgi:bacterioferritin-associated ferredoxin